MMILPTAYCDRLKEQLQVCSQVNDTFCFRIEKFQQIFNALEKRSVIIKRAGVQLIRLSLTLTLVKSFNYFRVSLENRADEIPLLYNIFFTLFKGSQINDCFYFKNFLIKSRWNQESVQNWIRIFEIFMSVLFMTLLLIALQH